MHEVGSFHKDCNPLKTGNGKQNPISHIPRFSWDTHGITSAQACTMIGTMGELWFHWLQYTCPKIVCGHVLLHKNACTT